MSAFGPLAVQGIASGAVICLMAVAFALVFAGSRVFHIAQAACFSIAAYVLAWTLGDLGWPVLLCVLLAVAASVVFGLVTAMAVYRPLEKRGADELGIAIGSLALVVITDNVLTMVFSTSPKLAPLDIGRERGLELAGTSLTKLQVFGIVFAVVSSVLVVWAMRATAWGRSVRGMVANPLLAGALGLPMQRLRLSIYAISGILAAFAGMHSAVDVGALSGRGLDVFLLASIAVFLGGLGSISGTAIIAFTLGFLANVMVIWVPSEWARATVFAAFVVLVMIRPHGLRPVGLEDR